MKKIIKLLIIPLTLIIVLLCYCMYIEPNLLNVKKTIIQSNQIKKDFKLVFFSDTHLGNMYPMKKIEKIVDLINQQNPDIVIFGGDFFDNYFRDEKVLDIDYITTALRNIKSTYGNYAVYGNHDHGGGASNIYKSVMEQGGFTILKNSNEYIDQLGTRLIGFDDMLLGYTSEELYNIKSEDYNLIISHEADVAKKITAKGDGLILGGHSHGGQVYLPFLINFYLPRGSREFVNGLYEAKKVGINDNVKVYVSSGIGLTFMPIRFLNPPRIELIEFTKTND